MDIARKADADKRKKQQQDPQPANAQPQQPLVGPVAQIQVALSVLTVPRKTCEPLPHHNKVRLFFEYLVYWTAVEHVLTACVQ